ncbi:UvrD-helicase domain-containing protein [Vibrio sp. PNB22_4_1]
MSAVHNIAHFMVIACHGSGKTAVLIQKENYLIDHCGVNSIHIVSLSRARANGLQARIHGLLISLFANPNHTEQFKISSYLKGSQALLHRGIYFQLLALP